MEIKTTSEIGHEGEVFNIPCHKKWVAVDDTVEKYYNNE